MRRSLGSSPLASRRPRAGPLLDDRVAAGDAIAALRRYSLVTPAGGRLWCWCTAWSRPSLSPRYAAELAGPVEAGCRGLSRGRGPRRHDSARGAGRCARCCCRTPRRLLPMTATEWPGLPTTSDPAAVTCAARDLWRRVLDAREQVLGPEHAETLFTRHQLARWTGEAGDPAGARDLFAGLLPVFERVLGPEHPRTLAARHQLARWTGQAGDPAGARDLFAGLVPVFERVLGPEHPRTLAPAVPRRPVDRGGGGPGRGPGPARRAAPCARAGPRPGA